MGEGARAEVGAFELKGMEGRAMLYRVCESLRFVTAPSLHATPVSRIGGLGLS